jgi:hypothetical protein
LRASEEAAVGRSGRYANPALRIYADLGSGACEDAPRSFAKDSSLLSRPLTASVFRVPRTSSSSHGLHARCIAISLLILAAADQAGCDREAESRAEARALLEKLNKLSANGTLAQRKQTIDALDQVTLRVPEHAHARDICRTAHLQLLQAEAAQVSARKSLEEATRTHEAGGVPIPPERGKAIAAELQQSTDALATAQREFPKCEQATIELTREAR